MADDWCNFGDSVPDWAYFCRIYILNKRPFNLCKGCNFKFPGKSWTNPIILWNFKVHSFLFLSFLINDLWLSNWLIDWYIYRVCTDSHPPPQIARTVSLMESIPSSSSLHQHQQQTQTHLQHSTTSGIIDMNENKLVSIDRFEIKNSFSRIILFIHFRNNIRHN